MSNLKMASDSLGWVVSDGPGCMERLARKPMQLPSRHTFIFNEDEERVDAEAALMLHRHHKLAFKTFPGFSDENTDVFYGMPKEDLLSMRFSGRSLKKSDWPWRTSESGATFDASVSLGFSRNGIGTESQKPAMIIMNMSARYPMIHLAWLWALESQSITLSPIFSSKMAMMIMAIHCHAEESAQVEFVYNDEPSRTIVSLMSQPVVGRSTMVLAVPIHIDAWLSANPGTTAVTDWSNHALYQLVKKGQQYKLKPVRDDEVLRRHACHLNWQSTSVKAA